jgi:hypothetical protein
VTPGDKQMKSGWADQLKSRQMREVHRHCYIPDFNLVAQRCGVPWSAGGVIRGRAEGLTRSGTTWHGRRLRAIL